MDTPRRGLIRATERAIEEYIKDGCEENLPMIRQLEDVAYQFWVESNTSFLNESLVTVGEDEEGWIWDEDPLFQSFSAHVEACLQDDNCGSGNLQEDADDTSSICSSIKPCDETDCSLGYLASCEESGTHACTDICKDCKECSTCEEYLVKDSGKNQPTTSTYFDYTDIRNGLDLQFDGRHEINALHNAQRSCLLGTAFKGRENVKNVREMLSYVDIVTGSSENEERPAVVEVNGFDLDADGDEWVVIDNGCIGTVPDNNWFIVSTTEPTGTVDKFDSKRYSSTKVCTELSVKSVNKSDSDSFDLSDWAVLSMKVTERSDRDQNETLKLKQTLLQSNFVLHDHEDERQFNNSISNTYDMSTLGDCPSCKSNKDKYKCAIFCVLIQR